MNTDIRSLHEQWDMLELELLIPVTLTDKQWETIIRVRSNPQNSRYLRHFRKILPLTVARFKDEEQQKILDWAHLQTEDLRYHYVPGITFLYKRSPFLELIGPSFGRDMKKIHDILRRIPSVTEDFSQECHVGLFTKPRAEGALHTDDNDDDAFALPVIYMARIGALPTEMIDGRLGTYPLTREIVTMTRLFGSYGRGILRRVNILRKIPLGDVVLVTPGRHGILHCASPVPLQGAHSGFFRYSENIIPT